MDMTNSFPAIDSRNNVCGGAACIVNTRIPVWTLEAARREGMTDGAILAAWPSLTAEDLASALEYAHRHKSEMDRKIAENGDDSL